MQRCSGILTLTLSLVLAVAAAGAADPFHYLDPRTVDLRTLLNDPPANDSPETRAELDEILARQQVRASNEVARARAEEVLQPAVFADVLGAWFRPEKVPVTTALLKRVQEDVHGVSIRAKNLWKRPRPPLLDARVQPAVGLPDSAAYPSGHATLGACWSRVLAELAPEYRKDLLARGQLIGQDRVLAGVHYPSDVTAGRKLGLAIADRLLALPAFHDDLAQARTELQPFLQAHVTGR